MAKNHKNCNNLRVSKLKVCLKKFTVKIISITLGTKDETTKLVHKK